MKALVLLCALSVASCERQDPATARLTLEFEFERPIPLRQLEEARQLVAQRVGAFGIVRLDRRRIVVDVEFQYAVEVKHLIIPTSSTLTLRIEDPSAEYMEKLGSRVKRDHQLAKLEVTANTDFGIQTREPIDRYLRAEDSSEYVNEKFADRVGCDKTDRLVGIGFSCWVTGKQKLEAAVHGDADLFVEPLLAVPDDREVLFEKQQAVVWRTRYVHREPIVADASSIRSVTREAEAMRVAVTDEVAQKLTACGDERRILWAVRGNTRVIEFDAARRELVIDATNREIDNFKYAVALARFAAKLVEVPYKPRSA